ncbi:copper homeostasis protein cutC [Moelleriella libera RCEF 2490]|uniref:Copper homeostasis protein cutC homolog n=1 Tax=Moelleriella libera RCEF 2490 TaxID=1081109 RepID=A0A166PKY7_9HYPO|nr:copper homeostasis protein cutC [Moelleriella libera RCEF 2490]
MTQSALRSSVDGSSSSSSSSKASTAIPLEVAVFSASAALRAQALGAARVELNAPNSYALGGTTPPLSELSLLRDESSSPSSSSTLKIPVRIMIRPRGPPPSSSSSSSSSSPAAAQDFVYTADEFQRMKTSIRRFKASGLLVASAHTPPPPPPSSPHSGDGFVFGILRAAAGPGGNDDVVGIDEHRCRELVALASPYPCVFHRAFDQIASRENAQLLADLGFAGVLTSGGLGNCVDNKASVGRLLEATTSSSSSSSGLEVIVGGGLRRDNIQVMAEQVRMSSLSTCGSGRAALHTAALNSSSRHHEEIDEDELSAMVAQLR